jgi:hypothetical protein
VSGGTHIHAGEATADTPALPAWALWLSASVCLTASWTLWPGSGAHAWALAMCFVPATAAVLALKARTDAPRAARLTAIFVAACNTVCAAAYLALFLVLGGVDGLAWLVRF